jgi:hypothetical protein
MKYLSIMDRAVRVAHPQSSAVGLVSGSTSGVDSERHRCDRRRPVPGNSGIYCDDDSSSTCEYVTGTNNGRRVLVPTG